MNRSLEKLAYIWEERALKAEAKLAGSVDWQISAERDRFEARLGAAQNLLAYANNHKVGPLPSKVALDGDKALELAVRITAFLHPEQSASATNRAVGGEHGG